jgi:hypothetical protein
MAGTAVARGGSPSSRRPALTVGPPCMIREIRENALRNAAVECAESRWEPFAL